MKVKDLRWQEMFVWPPEWDKRLENHAEEWILTEVSLHKDQDTPYIHIEAKYKNEVQEGVLHLEPHEHLDVLYQVLKENIGKTLAKIGDIKISFNL